jgi:hypothetical protein
MAYTAAGWDDLTKAISTLIEDAKKAGYTVTHKPTNERESQLHIFRPDRRSKDKILVGVNVYLLRGAFWEAHRTDIEGGLTTQIRSIKAVRQILFSGERV